MKLLIYALFVWRLSNIIVEEDFLFNLALRLRLWIGIRYVDHNGKALTKKETLAAADRNELYDSYYTISNNLIAKGFTCLWCISFWVGILATAMAYTNNESVDAIAMVFFFSAVAIAVNRMINA